MWAWRIVVPVAGLGVCLLVLWQSLPGEDARGAGPEGVAQVAVSLPERVVAEGRISPRSGAEITVGTEAGGLVVERPAREKARVKKGDLLVRFGSDDAQAALTGAEAALAEAEAEAEYQKREFKRRTQAPVDSKQFTANLDSGRRDYEVAAARRKAAAAALDRCRLALARTRITSPIDGVVVACYVQPGEIAPPGTRLVTVCDLARTWIEAEVDEFDATRITTGAEVTITAEGHPTLSWPGKVEEIPDRVADRTVKPDDPGRPTDTKVLLVKIAPVHPLPLKLGQQVEVQISTPVDRRPTPVVADQTEDVGSR